MKSVVWKRLLWAIIFLFCGIILATLLLVLVYALPTGRMRDNVNNSIDLFKTEGDYKELIPGIYVGKLDNYTDSVMLAQAIYDGEESVSIKAMNVMARMSKGKNYRESLIEYLDNGKSDGVHEYFWYWHGYMIYLKPLLLFFDYANIRLLNMAFVFITILFLGYEMYKRGVGKYIIPFGLALFLLSPITIMMSLQFSSCFYMMMLGNIVLLHFYDVLMDKKMYMFVFLFIGMGTSFFDFLTYPVVTLGIPLIWFFILNTNKSLWNMFKDFFVNTCFWGIGYVGMWCGKWAIASVILRKNCFIQAINKIMAHTSVDENITIAEVFRRNFEWTSERAYQVVMIAFLILLIVWLIKTGVDIVNLKCIIPILIIMLFPIAWYFFASSHAYFHYWMEYRECIVLIFGFYSVLLKLQKTTVFSLQK